MTTTLIDNAQLVFPGEKIAAGSILLSAGKIAAIDPDDAQVPADAERCDADGKQLTPGLIDLHTHGLHHFRYDAEPEQFLDAAKVLGAYGVTSLTPTLLPRCEPGYLERIAKFAAVFPRTEGVDVLGIHLEGPFMALPGCGCPTLDGDLGLLDELTAACGGFLRVMSLSPDTANILPVIERLREDGITPFITHTRATVAQTQAAIAAGARHATHFYDVFHVPDETDPGVRPVGAVEAILADPRCTVDFICDGAHVAPIVVQAALAAKGFAGIVLITDSNVGAGLPPGIYDSPWGYQVKVEEGNGARIFDESHPCNGGLAGSALTMNRGIRNLMSWLDLPPEQVWAMGSANPARVLGANTKGRLEADADADLVLWNEDFTPAKTWVGGKCTYTSID